MVHDIGFGNMFDYVQAAAVASERGGLVRVVVTALHPSRSRTFPISVICVPIVRAVRRCWRPSGASRFKVALRLHVESFNHKGNDRD